MWMAEGRHAVQWYAAGGEGIAQVDPVRYDIVHTALPDSRPAVYRLLHLETTERPSGCELSEFDSLPTICIFIDFIATWSLATIAMDDRPSAPPPPKV